MKRNYPGNNSNSSWNKRYKQAEDFNYSNQYAQATSNIFYRPPGMPYFGQLLPNTPQNHFNWAPNYQLPFNNAGVSRPPLNAVGRGDGIHNKRFSGNSNRGKSKNKWVNQIHSQNNRGVSLINKNLPSKLIVPKQKNELNISMPSFTITGLVESNTESELMDAISSEIIKYACCNAQTDDSYGKKVLLRNFLQSFLGLELYIVGSTSNGFALTNSDLDLCLRNSSVTTGPVQKDIKRAAINILKNVQRRIKRFPFIKNLIVIFARVPILKFMDAKSGIECDINVNNVTGIRNTYLLKAYSKIDARLKLLVLYVKFWARKHQINDASQGTFSSYSLSLMAIHYLQCACFPPILPNLQALYPKYFDVDINVNLYPDMKMDIEYESTNTSNIGSVFTGFLEYYSQTFNYETDVASVRLGRVIKKTAAQPPLTQWKFISLEEPFERRNVSHTFSGKAMVDKIIAIFKCSHKTLLRTRNLMSILRPFSSAQLKEFLS